MNTTRNNTLKIYMQGFDNRSLKTFEIFYQSKCNAKFHLTDDYKNASIAVIDFDVCHDKKLIEHLQNTNKSLFIIIVSLIEQDQQNPGVFFLQKPVNPEQLKQRLITIKKLLSGNKTLNSEKLKPKKTLSNRRPETVEATKTNNINCISHKKNYSAPTAAATMMSKEEESHYIGNNPDITLNDPHSILNAVYTARNKLQDAIVKAIALAKRDKCDIEMYCLNTGFVINFEENSIYTASSDNVLRPLCLLESEQPPVIRKHNSTTPVQQSLTLKNRNKSQLKIWSLDVFLWKIALWTSRGRFPEDTDLHTTAYLSEWPNFTRLQTFPHAMRIAALLHQQPTRLTEIASKLKIPQRYVFSFYSAAKAIEISGISRRKIDQTLKAAPQKKSSHRSVLQKVLNKLNIHSSQKKQQASA